MNKKARAHWIAEQLAILFPDAKAELNFSNPYELLVATILSAQSTDRRVNLVTEKLFKLAPTPQAMLSLSREELEQILQSLGMYRQKAKHLQGSAQMIVELHGGEVPQARQALEALPGVGRKTANVVLSNAFGVPAIAVDTHVLRVSYRLGLTSKKDPLGVEKDLQKLLPREIWSVMHHRLIFLGRRICSARNPRCTSCALAIECPKKGVA